MQVFQIQNIFKQVCLHNIIDFLSVLLNFRQKLSILTYDYFLTTKFQQGFCSGGTIRISYPEYSLQLTL